jgi:hypothetical protein
MDDNHGITKAPLCDVSVDANFFYHVSFVDVCDSISLLNVSFPSNRSLSSTKCDMSIVSPFYICGKRGVTY